MQGIEENKSTHEIVFSFLFAWDCIWIIVHEYYMYACLSTPPPHFSESSARVETLWVLHDHLENINDKDDQIPITNAIER
jgi:hypothetical protein